MEIKKLKQFFHRLNQNVFKNLVTEHNMTLVGNEKLSIRLPKKQI